MKNIITLICVFSLYFAFSQNTGINTPNPTETLDINGGVRIRDIPITGSHRSVVVIDDTGKLYQLPYDSLQSSANTKFKTSTLSLIAGDTIHAGDCISLGDGLTGISRIQTSAYPYTADPMTKTWWLAQTFITPPKTVAIKALVFDLEVSGANPSDTLICSIRELVGGIPTGPDINNQQARVEGPNGNSVSYTNARVLFHPPLVLQPNKAYALVVRTGFTTATIHLHKQNLGMYPSGHALVSMNAGATWQVQTAFDFNVIFYLCETEAGKAYPSSSAYTGSSTVGYSAIDIPCFESNGCNPNFYGKNDRYDNVIGIAQQDVLPGQLVPIQINGFTDLVTGFPLGKKLFVSPVPGQVSVSGTKTAGLSTGNGMIIQVTY